MPTILNDAEVRVLGSLIEKQVTTPDYYPLTLNSLTLACNQKNNRNPITSFTEAEVSQALDSLREKNLAYVFYGSSSRVPKYKHVITEVLHFSPQQLAVMCVLMLRGAQTVGELRERGARLCAFTGLEEVERTLDSLITREPDPLVVKLPRLPGHKEARYMHLLAGEVDVDLVEAERPERRRATDAERIAKLEQQIESLRLQFEEFKKQFE